MFNKTRLSLFVVVVGIALALVGCGQPPTAEPSVAVPPVPAETSPETPGAAAPAADESAVHAPAPVVERAKDAVATGVERAREAVTAVTAPAPTIDLPATFDTPMAFARQAPFGAWEVAFYQDACEEASLIIINQHFKGLPLDEAIMKSELGKVEPWELERFGENLSVDTESVATMAREFYGLNATVTDEVTLERIKQELVAGNFIILPLTGQDLHNPNFTGAGPLYHMLVVRGYDRDQLITNDPGTRKGQGYKYDYDVILNAVHDWNGGDIYNGKRLMIVVTKPQ